MNRILPVHPGCCCVCRRPECGAGYSPPGRSSTFTVTWACDAHIDLARVVHLMPIDRLNLLEEKALESAGGAMGDYLEHIGITDLADLTPEQFATATATLLDAFGEALADQLRAHSAPF